jgi:hypothetical protein
LVTYLGRHFVINIYFLPEKAVIPEITVMVFVIRIQGGEELILFNVPVEIAFSGMWTIPAVSPPEGAVFAIKFQVTVSKNLCGLSIDPPVKQVEMVGCLMYPKGPTVFR